MARTIGRLTTKLLPGSVVRRWRQRIRTIFVPCRMCEAGPGEPCKYKGREITGSIPCYQGTKLPKEDRRFHYKRIDDAIAIADLLAARRTSCS